MTIQSLIDERKKKRVRDAIAKGDASIFKVKKAEPEPPKILRIRGPGLEVLVTRKNGCSFREALRKADAGNRVIASNERLDDVLLPNIPFMLVGDPPENEELRAIWLAFPCWTGTVTAYQEPEKSLGSTIEYIDERVNIRYVFPVPKKFKGVKDAILVAEHPDYTVEKDGDDRVIHAAHVDLIEKFPAENGWYVVDPKHGITTCDNVQIPASKTRYLFRIGKRVGPVGRSVMSPDHIDGKNYILLDAKPAQGAGVIVEAPALNKSGDKP